MYLHYFGFAEEPFNITPNTRFLFPSPKHREALGSLLYGIEQRKGFIVLTGDIGCGKTTICRSLLTSLDREKTRIALILNPQLSDLELLQSINAEFGILSTSTSKRELLDALNRFLLDQLTQGHNVVLLIDESQRLSPDALEQVRLISNLETESAKLIQIALVGQPELDDILHLPQLEQLNQRVTVRCHIEPLNADEMGEYITHRLDIAQPKLPVRFHKKALRRIFQHTGGVPRRVNVLCDRCLLITFNREQVEVSEEIVEQAIREVAGSRKRKKPGPAAAAPMEDEDSPLPAEPATTGTYPRSAVMVASVLFVAAAAWLIHRSRETLRAEMADAKRTIAIQEPAQPAPTSELIPLPSPTPVVSPEHPEIPAPTPAPTAIPTPEPTAKATPAPTAAPTASPEPTPSLTPRPTPEPTAEPTAFPHQPWSYDAEGIMRHPSPEFSYVASLLTWLSKSGVFLPNAELETLRTMDAATIGGWRLATGAPPHFLREASLAPSSSALTAITLPALAQFDRSATGISPWAVVTGGNADGFQLLDPVHGSITVPAGTLENHLAGLVAPYRDPDRLTGLRPLDTGESVRSLQTRLITHGFLSMAPSGTFDSDTEKAVARARSYWKLGGAAMIDPLLALHLYQDRSAAKP